jgi:hypothetical protein
MTYRVTAGPPATLEDRRVAAARLSLVRDQVPRIRAAATAWRNGLGALLAGLVGFGLVKGRTEISDLAHPFDAAVGVFLLLGLLAGIRAAWLLLRAAHGVPKAVRVEDVLDVASPDPGLRGTLVEASESASALRRGVRLSLLCVLLLATAVAVTWYGPAREEPRVALTLDNAPAVCGEVIRVDGGRLTLRTEHGEVTADLGHLSGLAGVATCPKAR